MSHQHSHPEQEKCCSATAHQHHEHEHNHEHGGSVFSLFQQPLISFCLLLLGIGMDYFQPAWFTDWVRVAWYFSAYVPVGMPVLKEAIESIRNNDFFSEFFLMTIATIGAFAIGQYPEAVAVMLFYSIGEAFQTMAVSKAKGNKITRFFWTPK